MQLSRVVTHTVSERQSSLLSQAERSFQTEGILEDKILRAQFFQSSPSLLHFVRATKALLYVQLHIRDMENR